MISSGIALPNTFGKFWEYHSPIGQSLSTSTKKRHRVLHTAHLGVSENGVWLFGENDDKPRMTMDLWSGMHHIHILGVLYENIKCHTSSVIWEHYVVMITIGVPHLETTRLWIVQVEIQTFDREKNDGETGSRINYSMTHRLQWSKVLINIHTYDNYLCLVIENLSDIRFSSMMAKF